MGAAAPYVWPMVGMLGSQVIGSVMAPEGQELQTFEGEGELDPRKMLGESRSQLSDMIGLLKQRANQPVSLPSAYAQHLPVFTGGGLPMPIGAYGVDPALNNPSLLTSNPRSGLLGANVDPVPRDRYNPPRGTGEAGDTIPPRDPDNPTSHPYSTGNAMPMRRNISGTSLFSQPQAGGEDGDDLMQGAGAAELLLRSLAQP